MENEGTGKKNGKGYSLKSIEQCTLDVDPEDQIHSAVSIVYGIVTQYFGGGETILINSDEFADEEIIKKLRNLSMERKKTYCMSVLVGNIEEEGDPIGLAVIGRAVMGNVIEGRDGSAKIVSEGNLVQILQDSEEIISDLESIGFVDIDKKDLHLLAGYNRY